MGGRDRHEPSFAAVCRVPGVQPVAVRARLALVGVAAVAPVDEVAPGLPWALRVYPFRYLRCSTCQVPARKYCVSRSGRIVDGRPDGVEQVLQAPHSNRKISKRK